MARLLASIFALVLLSGCTAQGWRAAMRGLASYRDPGVVAPAQTQQPMRTLKRSYVSGLNRICIYDQMGSEQALTIGATDLCPIM